MQWLHFHGAAYETQPCLVIKCFGSITMTKWNRDKSNVPGHGWISLEMLKTKGEAFAAFCFVSLYWRSWQVDVGHTGLLEVILPKAIVNGQLNKIGMVRSKWMGSVFLRSFFSPPTHILLRSDVVVSWQFNKVNFNPTTMLLHKNSRKSHHRCSVICH